MGLLRLTQEFDSPVIVPHHRSLSGGHRFTFTDLDGRTRIDHEFEMVPKGILKLMSPLMSTAGRKNLQATADALGARFSRS